jgi:hypothetical protein
MVFTFSTHASLAMKPGNLRHTYYSFLEILLNTVPVMLERHTSDAIVRKASSNKANNT